MRSRDLRALSIAFCLTLSVTGCGKGSNLPNDLPRGELTISRDGSRIMKLKVAIADDAEERNEGLRGVEDLPDDQGLAFLWPEPIVTPFYMEGTLLPLQVASWDESGRIVSIMSMAPCRSKPCPLYESGQKIVGAVEVAQGVLDDAGVEIGDVVTLIPDKRPGRR